MEIRERIARLLRGSRLVLHDHSGGGVVFVGPDHYWDPLPADLRILQHELRQDALRWFEMVSTISAGMKSDIVSKVSHCQDAVMSVIDQDQPKWSGDLHRIAADLWKDLTALVQALREVHPRGDVALLVPDTNALLYNPQLEAWRFAEAQPFQLILVPTVLSELDELKEGRLGQSRTEKANKINRQIKEYGRRGNASRGVPLVTGISTFRMIAPEPQMDRTLPWLDRSVNDDRILASYLEIVRQSLNSPTALVTRDVGLQNKASMAGVRWLEPPDPPMDRDSS